MVTIVQKSDLSIRKRGAKTALIITGGALTGGAYELGGLKALNDLMVNKGVTDFDIYVGLSAGAFLAAPLACGISPEELLASLDGKSEILTQFSLLDLYYPNWSEFILKPLNFLYELLSSVPRFTLNFLQSSLPGSKLFSAFTSVLRRPSYSSIDNFIKTFLQTAIISQPLPSIFEALPTGIFDNSHIEKYFRENFRRNGWKNTFVDIYNRRRKELYITAINLDTAERVVFGYDENSSLTVSEAIQAATALPVFFKPARIKGIDYIDGGVAATVSIDIAIKHGASLIVCYNPFRPIKNELVVKWLKELDSYVTDKPHLAERGLLIILSQALRTLLHTRLHATLKQFEDNIDFRGDIILIEPDPYEYEIFHMNPLAFWRRVKAAEDGFFSAKRSLESNYPMIKKILGSYGIEATMLHIQQNVEKLSGGEDVASEVLTHESIKRDIRVL